MKFKNPKTRNQSALEDLLAAIVENDCVRVKALLKAEGSLATALTREASLFRSKIFHWMYVGDTALHLAAAGHRAELVRLLLAAGADPNANSNHRESTPLHYAADGAINTPAYNEEKQIETIRCLLHGGANIQVQDKNGATPLHRAVRTRCAGAVRCLLKAGADPEVKNKPGSTPFHLAVQNTGRGGSGSAEAIAAQRSIIEKLLAFGANPRSKSGTGKTVFASVQSSWIRELPDFLK